jgi:4-hydroxybenzoyl-CoA reductase subunit beta
MLRLPLVDVEVPASLEEALEALDHPNARPVAGGTDLLPNLKHRLEGALHRTKGEGGAQGPARLVSLHGLAELRRAERDEEAGVLRLGAGLTMSALASHPEVRALWPSLAEAASCVAGPQIRNQATLGGNLNLDTRCRYVNQTQFWRSAIGGCLKSDGDVCHVVPGGVKCVAALSSDCAPVLISLDAEVVLRRRGAERAMALSEYYRADGIHHTRLTPGELLTEVRVPLPRGPRRTAYVKWRVRGSIDFPLVSVALRFDLVADGASEIAAARVVAGVLGARPRVVRGLEALRGRALDDPEVADEVAAAVHAQCRPLENVPYEADYRRHLYRVLTRRAVRALSG